MNKIISVDNRPALLENHKRICSLLSAIKNIAFDVQLGFEYQDKSQAFIKGSAERFYSTFPLLAAKGFFKFETSYTLANSRLAMSQGKDPIIRDSRRDEYTCWHRFATDWIWNELAAFCEVVRECEGIPWGEGDSYYWGLGPTIDDPPPLSQFAERLKKHNADEKTREKYIQWSHRHTRFNKNTPRVRIRDILIRLTIEFGLAVTVVNDVEVAADDRNDSIDLDDRDRRVCRNAARDDRFIALRREGKTFKEIAAEFPGETFSEQMIDGAISRRCETLGIEKPLVKKPRKKRTKPAGSKRK